MYRLQLVYTVSQKGPTFKLSVTLSNLNRFSKYMFLLFNDNFSEMFYIAQIQKDSGSSAVTGCGRLSQPSWLLGAP